MSRAPRKPIIDHRFLSRHRHYRLAFWKKVPTFSLQGNATRPGSVVIEGSDDEEIQGGGETFTTDGSLPGPGLSPPPFLRLKVVRTTAQRKSKRASKPFAGVMGQPTPATQRAAQNSTINSLRGQRDEGGPGFHTIRLSSSNSTLRIFHFASIAIRPRAASLWFWR